VRKQQDAATELQELNKTLLAEIARPAKERKFQEEQALRAHIVKVEATLVQLNERLQKEFPRYAELVDPKPLTLKQVQSLVAPDEALLVYHLGSRAQFVFAVTRDRVEWEELPLDTDDIADKVQVLRDQLDPDAAAQGRAVFDLRTAHDLYNGVLSPVETAILSKPHLLIVATGPLTSLPFQVLVTQPPTSATGRAGDYLAAAWLTLRHSLTVLPSVGSIQVLREVAARNAAPLPYIGFGDPVFRPGGGGSTRTADKTAAKRAISYRDAFRGSRANADSLSRALAPLPDTADELRAFAKTLKVPETALRLGPSASETTVKSLRLADFRIVHFATHALVAGEVALFSEQAEPALALTIPSAATSSDDGLLTSSEVAALTLNANWVILSACNTAAGDKPGAEALTGLARAFFYAGARTLLVSHWPVQSAAAVQLTTRTIALIDEKPELPPAEALRLAMVDLMKDKSNEINAHPAIWAPFVVVGTTKRKR
jgi:CHAT domain-containing protein